MATEALGLEQSGLGYQRVPAGYRFPLERAGDALQAIDERRATGKVVLEVRPG